MALTDGLLGSWHMNSGWTDSSGNGYDFTTIVGAIIDNGNQHLGAGCGRFDGIDDYASQTLPAALKTANVAYAAWVNPDVNNVNQMLVSGTPKGTSAVGLGFRIRITSAGKAQVILGTGAGNTTVTGTATLNTTDYHRVIGTYDGSNIRIFVDGVYEGIAAEAAGIDWVDNGIGPDPAQLYLGATRNNTAGTAGNSNFLDGLLDEANIWDRALSYGGVSVGQVAGGEIAEDYNGDAGVESPASEIKSFRGLGKGLMKGLGRGL